MFAWAAFSSAARAADSALWQATPYKVRILTAFAACPELPAGAEADFCDELTARIEGVVGAPWDVVVLPAEGDLRRAMLLSLSGIPLETASRTAGNDDRTLKGGDKSDKAKPPVVPPPGGKDAAAKPAGSSDKEIKPAEIFDKVIFLAVQPEHGVLRVAVREFDDRAAVSRAAGPFGVAVGQAPRRRARRDPRGLLARGHHQRRR